MSEQLNLLDARAAGTVAGEACAEKAEAVAGLDRIAARAKLLELLRAFGPASGEDLVEWLKAAGFKAHDDRAFGAVFQSLARCGRIRCIAYCPRRRGHGSAGGRVWAIA